MKLLTTFLFLTIIICSCKKDKLCRDPNYNANNCIRDSAQIKTLILGKWSWMRTTDIERTETPCNTDKNLDYEFDSTGIMKIFRNGVFVGERTYVLLDSTGMIYFEDSLLLGNGFPLWASVCDNYLLLGRAPADESTSVYLRTN
jgi:hypothetical protein